MKITIYTTPSCPYSKLAKGYLTEKGFEFEEKDARIPKEGQEMVKISSQAGVPVIDIDGHIIVGWDKDRIDKALNVKPWWHYMVAQAFSRGTLEQCVAKMEVVVEEAERRAKEFPYSISEWERIGKERGYWDYYLRETQRAKAEEIKSDLLKIADEGEYEDLRREVEHYFSKIK